MAKGDGRCTGSLSAGEKTAEGGDLLALRPNEAGGGFSSVEHSGRERQKDSEGVRAVSVDSERLGVRAGNTASSLREDKISFGNGNSAGDGFAFRSGEDAQHDNGKTKKLTTDHYSLITKTAQAILDTRAKYQDSSLADLYDETLMPPDLRKAHEANDKAVMAAYGFDAKMTEAEVVAELFKMYEEMAKQN